MPSELLVFAAFVLTIGLPIAWLVSEFQPRRWLRMALGSGALAMCFGVAFIAGSLDRFNSNAWYGGASLTLVETTVKQLEAGNTTDMINNLKLLQSKFQPTYENRAGYDQLVNEYVERFKASGS